MTRPGKINPCEHKKSLIISPLLYLNLLTVISSATSSLSLLQNLMGLLLQFTERDTTFRTEDISKNITLRNLHSHGWYSQARSHIYNSLTSDTFQIKFDWMSDLFDINSLIKCIRCSTKYVIVWPLSDHFVWVRISTAIKSVIHCTAMCVWVNRSNYINWIFLHPKVTP